jgi:molybdopterin synthase sulfur carrier subunit
VNLGSDRLVGNSLHRKKAGLSYLRLSINMIRVILPFHLRTLAHAGSEVTLEVESPVTQRAVLDALEARYPMLRGAIRDHDTLQRRPFLRFFACEEDLSHEPPDTPLPDAVVSGKEPFIVIGAIAGG